jgi:hypothetical protein
MIEFAFVVLMLVPLLLGTGVVGVNMIRTMETIQLARDAGHMYARGLDFSQPGNKTVLVQLGQALGLSTAASANSLVILTTLTYVDAAACTAQSYTTANCPNYQKWVFTQRLNIGNTNLRASNVGSPATSGAGAVTVNASTGKISAADYVGKSGARATFTGVNPYTVTNGNVSGLPSGEVLYIAEAGATGFTMRPFVNNASTYSYGLF